ncbi:hypothetical protein [Spiroplasma endosymbiont of Cantharis nigra]|uniref:hypothetical protein n=1 Tax=Spiroplasma endosymbiont of Cantharis nigra TaxID=3066278 RepID=UPI0030D18CE6
MKKYGFEMDDYNLPSSIRKRIDDLVELNINPSTINLITTEFSSSSEETKENIGRYITKLLEIEDFIIYQNSKKSGGSNLKQDLNSQKRHSNLLIIQQIFQKKQTNGEALRKKYQTINNISENLHSFTGSMEEINKMQDIASKKLKIQMAIQKEQEKIKLAQKQYEIAKFEDDEITQELKLNIAKFANNRLKKISNVITTYKTIDKIPDEIIEENFYNDESEFDYKEMAHELCNLDESEFNSEILKTIEINLETFFDVPGFDDYQEEMINMSRSRYTQEYRNKSEKRELKKAQDLENSLKDNKITHQVEKKVESNIDNQVIYNSIEQNHSTVKKEIKNNKDSQEFILNENKNTESKLNKNSKESNNLTEPKVIIKEINSYLFENKNNRELITGNKFQKDLELSEAGEKNNILLFEANSEKIIKKIKKKARAKDRQIEKLIRENEFLHKELTKLREERKISELRELENRKRKLNENFEDTIKKEKRKIETTFQILERKWRAETINRSLNSKQKAFRVVNSIKEKSKLLQEPDNSLQVIIENKNVEQLKDKKENNTVNKKNSTNKNKVINYNSENIVENKSGVNNLTENKMLSQKQTVNNNSEISVENNTNNLVNNTKEIIVTTTNTNKNQSKIVNSKRNNSKEIIVNQKISFANKNNFSTELKNQNQYEGDEKRILYLESRKNLNIITKDEAKELELKKKKNHHTSSKIVLSKYKLVKR